MWDRDSLSSGERNGISLNSEYVIGLHRCISGVVGTFWAECKIGRRVRNLVHSRRQLERATREGDSPVCEMDRALWELFLSTVGHEESCRNLGGPPSKAKYKAATDRE